MTHPDCKHVETYSDGTTRFCDDCGADTHWKEPESDWHEGPVPPGMWWTEDGWVPSAAPTPATALVRLSEWIDAGNADRDPEAVTWGRISKITEEAGEVIAAFIGATGQNPRKGVTHTPSDVRKELLDVAITALGALEHLDGHGGHALDDLHAAIQRVHDRALGVES